MESLLNSGALKSSLKKLDFALMSGVSAENLQALSACTELEHLGLPHCIPEPMYGAVTDDLIAVNTALMQLCTNLPKLRVLDLTFCGVLPTTVLFLAEHS